MLVHSFVHKQLTYLLFVVFLLALPLSFSLTTDANVNLTTTDNSIVVQILNSITSDSIEVTSSKITILNFKRDSAVYVGETNINPNVIYSADNTYMDLEFTTPGTYKIGSVSITGDPRGGGEEITCPSGTFLDNGVCVSIETNVTLEEKINKTLSFLPGMNILEDIGKKLEAKGVNVTSSQLFGILLSIIFIVLSYNFKRKKFNKNMLLIPLFILVVTFSKFITEKLPFLKSSYDKIYELIFNLGMKFNSEKPLFFGLMIVSIALIIIMYLAFNLFKKRKDLNITRRFRNR